MTDNNNGEATTTDMDRMEVAKIKHWKESKFAVGLVNISWADDRIDCKKATAAQSNDYDQGSRSSNGNSMNLCSAYICGCLGADRIGNMAVLAQTTEEYDHHVMNEDTGEFTIEKRTRPKLLWVVRRLSCVCFSFHFRFRFSLVAEVGR